MTRKLNPNFSNLARLGAYTLLAGLLLVFAAPLGGWKALEVLTPSMTPAVHAGDLVLVHRVAPASLRPGNIITYTNPNHPQQTITHRVVRVERINGVNSVITKGDANQVTDQPVPIGQVVGRVAVITPGLGHVLGWVKSPVGVLLLVVIPGLLVIWHEAGTIRRTLRAPRPRPGPSRRIDGLYRPAAVLLVGGLAVAAGGFTLSQTIATVHLNANSFTASATGTPTPTPRPTVTPTPTTGPTASPSPGTGCGNVSISNTGPGSTNEVRCSNVNINSSSSSNSVHISAHSSQSTSTGSVHVSNNTSSGGGTVGGTSNHSSSDITVTIP